MRELPFLCDGILFLFLFRVVSVCSVQGTAADAIRETKGTNHNEVDRGQRRREMFLLIIKLLSVRRHEGCRFVTRMNTHYKFIAIPDNIGRILHTKLSRRIRLMRQTTSQSS
jgi:hypothetical protein